MTADWHKEHEKAMELAMNEAKGHFNRCPRCHRGYVTCVGTSRKVSAQRTPRGGFRVAAVRAKKMVKDVEEKAESTKVFNGEIDRQQTLCPNCGKPAGEGKFCVNCGTNLQLQECSNCGEKIPTGQRFCGECGTRLQ